MHCNVAYRDAEAKTVNYFIQHSGSGSEEVEHAFGMKRNEAYSVLPVSDNRQRADDNVKN